MTASTVYLVDDDLDLRDALACVLTSAGLPHRVYSTPTKLLDDLPHAATGCLVVDVRLPGMSGLELMQELRRRCMVMPVVMMSAHADVSVIIQAFKLGALDFLVKPFESSQFLDAIRQALAADEERCRAESRMNSLKVRMQLLTAKDWRVIEMLRSGQPNKRIAATLGVSERAVEMRRSNILKKTSTSSLPALIELLASGPSPRFSSWEEPVVQTDGDC